MLRHPSVCPTEREQHIHQNKTKIKDFIVFDFTLHHCISPFVSLSSSLLPDLFPPLKFYTFLSSIFILFPKLSIFTHVAVISS